MQTVLLAYQQIKDFKVNNCIFLDTPEAPED